MPGERDIIEELQYAVRMKVRDIVDTIKSVKTKIGVYRKKDKTVRAISTIATSQQIASSTTMASENANLMAALPKLLQETIGAPLRNVGDIPDILSTMVQDTFATALSLLESETELESDDEVFTLLKVLQESYGIAMGKVRSVVDEQDDEQQSVLSREAQQIRIGDSVSPMMAPYLRLLNKLRQTARFNMENSNDFAFIIIQAMKMAISIESDLGQEAEIFSEIEKDIQEFTSFPQSLRETAIQILRELGDEQPKPLEIIRKISRHYFELVQKPACKFVHVAPLEEAARSLPEMKSFITVDANELDVEICRQIISYKLVFGVILLHLGKTPNEFDLLKINKKVVNLMSNDPNEFPIIYFACNLDSALTESSFMLSPLATVATNCDPGEDICQLSQDGKKSLVAEVLKNFELLDNATVRDTVQKQIRDFVVALGRVFGINGETVHGILKHLIQNEIISAEGEKRLSISLQYESTDNFGDVELISTMLRCKDILQAYLSDGNNFEQIVSSSSFDTNDRQRIQEYFRDNSLLYICNSRATAYLAFCTLYSVAIAVRYGFAIVLEYKQDGGSWTTYISLNQGIFDPIFRNAIAKLHKINDSTTELLCEPIFPLGMIAMNINSAMVKIQLSPEMITLFENRLNTLEEAIPENSFRLVSFEEMKRIMELGKMALQHDGTPEYTKRCSDDFYSLFNEFADENLISDELLLQLRPLVSDIPLHFSEIFDLLITTSFDLLRPETILKRRLEKRISEPAIKTQEIGSEGGDAVICGCLVKFSPKSVAKKTEFKLKVTSNPKKYPSASIPISSILECSPSMRFDEPVTITMKTWCSSRSGVGSEAQVMSKKGNEEWKTIAHFNLGSENVVTFSVKHFCQYCVVQTNQSRDQDYHLTNEMYMKKYSGDIVSVFYKDDKTKEDLQKSFKETGYKRISPAPENLIVREGMKITQEMEVRIPNDFAISCLPGNDIKSLTSDVIKLTSFQTYYEFEQNLRPYQGLIRLRYWLKLIRENVELRDQRRGIPINLNWPEDLIEREPLQTQSANALVYVAPESAVGSITIQHSTASSTVHSALPVQQPQHLREQGEQQEEHLMSPQQVEEHPEELPRDEPVLNNPIDDRSSMAQHPQSSGVAQERESPAGNSKQRQTETDQIRSSVLSPVVSFKTGRPAGNSRRQTETD